MADLIAIGYDDTNAAVQAMDEVERLAKEAEAELQKELHGAPA